MRLKDGTGKDVYLYMDENNKPYNGCGYSYNDGNVYTESQCDEDAPEGAYALDRIIFKDGVGVEWEEVQHE